MTSGGKPDEPDAPLARGPPAGDLGAQRAERGGMRNVDRVAEHALLDAYLAEPPGYRLGLVRGVRGIPRRREGRSCAYEHDLAKKATAGIKNFIEQHCCLGSRLNRQAARPKK